MTVAQFQFLSEMEKLKVLIRYGILVGETKDKNFSSFTYQVQSFFVETKYTLETNDLLSIESFSNVEEEDTPRWSNLNFAARYPRNYPE